MTAKGFTITEILISISILGILAGLAVVGYGSWQQRITEDAIKSDLQGVNTAMESARNFSNGYPLAIPTTFSSSSKVVLTYEYGDATSYCISGSGAADPSIVYHVIGAASAVPQSGNCPPQ